MPDWNTRLAVSYTDASGNHAITPVDSYNPNFTIGADSLHSLEATHIGVVYSPHKMGFTLAVKQIGDAAAQLTILAMQGKRFDLVLQEANGSDWSFTKVVLSNCIIQGANTTTSVTGAPTVSFTGVSLGASVQAATGGQASLPT
jgi:thiamine pyrophosphokinase